MDFRPPKYVLHVLASLEAAGFKAHLVGGCVRDIFMGRRPTDWDVCTDALPEAVAKIFSNSRPTGIKHGTVTVISRGRGVEVTTYRTDGTYSDYRRPDKVEFISDLCEDLARRDFTMNAIAMTGSGEVFDPFGGRADIDARLICCVGDPERRFDEDALRILRALRFSAVLGFDIEERTMDAIMGKAHLLRHIAPERIGVELGKTLLSPRPEKAFFMLGIIIFEGQGEILTDACAKRLRYLPKNAAMRWAALCALLSRHGAIHDPKSFLLSLRLDSHTVRHASAGCSLALNGRLSSHPDLKRLIAAHGDETAMCAVSAMYTLYGGGILRTMGEVRGSGECCRISDLAVTGDELVALGYGGRAVGEALQKLLEHVIMNPSDNKRDILIDSLRQ